MSRWAAEFEDVTKTYGAWPSWRRVVALRGVTLRFAEGETAALLGPNRAGKTTLLKILLGVCTPGKGTVRRMGHPLSVRRTLERCGYVHEDHAFPRYLTAQGVLAYCGTLTRMSAGRVALRSAAVLERVGLADRAAEPIANFSKGMRQRLGLAQALLNDPDLLALDEPTEGLDQNGRDLLAAVVAERKAAGRTTLFVSHTLPEVERLCDRAAVVLAGKLAFDGTLAELRGRDAAGSLEGALRSLYAATPAEAN